MPVTPEDVTQLKTLVARIVEDAEDEAVKREDRQAKSTAADAANEAFHEAEKLEQAAAGKTAADFAALRAFVDGLT